VALVLAAPSVTDEPICKRWSVKSFFFRGFGRGFVHVLKSNTGSCGGLPVVCTDALAPVHMSATCSVTKSRPYFRGAV
jgi:hypothetical protein